jgi:hypothetical protein
MAKKARKKSAAKAKTKGKKKTKVLPKQAVRRKKAKAAAKNKKARRAKPTGFTDKIAGAYHTVIDTLKGTDALRNKLERPGTSETE